MPMGIDDKKLPIPVECSTFDAVVLFDVFDEEEKTLQRFDSAVLAADSDNYRSEYDYNHWLTEELQSTKLPLDVVGVIVEYAKNRVIFDDDVESYLFPRNVDITQGTYEHRWSHETTRLLCTWGFSEFKIAYERGQAVIDEKFDEVASDFEDKIFSASLLRRLAALDFPINAFEFCAKHKIDVNIRSCKTHDEIDAVLDEAHPDAISFVSRDGRLAVFIAIVRVGADDLCRHDNTGYWKQLPEFKVRKEPPRPEAPELLIGGYGLFQHPDDF